MASARIGRGSKRSSNGKPVAVAKTALKVDWSENKKRKKDNILQYMSYTNCAENTAVKKVILTSRARDNHGSIQVSICFFV